MNNKEYIVYTDGGCENNSFYKEGGAAYIILLDGKEIKRASRGFLNTSNNRMEMLAIISAVAAIEKGAKIKIYSDSQLAINLFSYAWKPKTNIDLMNKYREVSKGKIISYEWIKGHNGNYYNEIVDSLCTKCIEDIVLSNNLPKDRFGKIKKKVEKTLFD